MRNTSEENLVQIPDPDTQRAGRGRPRDPALEGRVFDAAMALYADGGWPALTFDAVGRAASVGKSALYRRWPTRGDLLRETLEARWYALNDADTGSFRADMQALARMCFDTLVGPYGGVILHLRVDARRFSEVRTAIAPYARSMKQQARMIVQRAIARGEAPADTHPGLILDVVFGAVTNHVSVTPRRRWPVMIAQSDGFITQLIDLLIMGVAKPSPD